MRGQRHNSSTAAEGEPVMSQLRKDSACAQAPAVPQSQPHFAAQAAARRSKPSPDDRILSWWPLLSFSRVLKSWAENGGKALCFWASCTVLRRALHHADTPQLQVGIVGKWDVLFIICKMLLYGAGQYGGYGEGGGVAFPARFLWALLYEMITATHCKSKYKTNNY